MMSSHPVAMTKSELNRLNTHGVHRPKGLQEKTYPCAHIARPTLRRFACFPRTSKPLLSIVTAVISPLLISTACSTPLDTNPASHGETFSAELLRSCGPADGPALLFTIPLTPERSIDELPVIHINIWDSESQIKNRQFPLSDNSSLGVAYVYHAQLEPVDYLQGTVKFGNNVTEGTFTLRSANGQAFEGRFNAKWREPHEPMLCG